MTYTNLCLDAVNTVVRKDWFGRLGINRDTGAQIRKSWLSTDVGLYGRFDMLYDGTGNPKLLEYNADTPTCLLESAVTQWDWLTILPGQDQFNSLHEKLVARWKFLADRYKLTSLCVTSLDNEEDVITSSYIQDTAAQAGLQTTWIALADIGIQHSARSISRSGR